MHHHHLNIGSNSKDFMKEYITGTNLSQLPTLRKSLSFLWKLFKLIKIKKTISLHPFVRHIKKCDTHIDMAPEQI